MDLTKLHLDTSTGKIWDSDVVRLVGPGISKYFNLFTDFTIKRNEIQMSKDENTFI